MSDDENKRTRVFTQQRTTGNDGERGGDEHSEQTRQDSGPGAVAVPRTEGYCGYTEEHESGAIGGQHTGDYMHNNHSKDLHVFTYFFW